VVTANRIPGDRLPGTQDTLPPCSYRPLGGFAPPSGTSRLALMLTRSDHRRQRRSKAEEVGFEPSVGVLRRARSERWTTHDLGFSFAECDPSADQRHDAMAGATASSPRTGRRPSDSLLAKPDRALLWPGRTRNGAGRGRFVIDRGCPLVTGRDCCEWHASGTAGEADLTRLGAVGSALTQGEARPR
jgi:hypothetical protein